MIALLTGTGACATAGGGDDTTGGQGGDATTTTGAHGATTATSGSAGTGGAAAAVNPPYCHTPCNSNNDCALGTAPIYDASHWSCNKGTCDYLGCTGDFECTNPGYLCLLGEGASVPSCQPSCSSPSDCGSANGNPLFADDHYTCDNGTCTQLGCNSDAECSWMHPDGFSLCREISPGFKWCVTPCSSVNDCFLPDGGAAHDADNYACLDGICSYTGCNSDEECKSGFPSEPNIVCFQP